MNGSRPRRVLVLEGDPEVSHLLAAILERDDREVAVTRTGARAREILEGATPDLVILDLMLPDVDGRTFLTSLRETAATADTPLVVLNSRSGVELRRESYRLGADAYFERPFDPESLMAEVEVHLARAAERAHEALRDPLTGLLNLEGLRQEYGGLSGPGAVVMIEIDGFASLSERWGWGTAERIAYDVGRALDAFATGRICAARVAGGEFALLLPDTRLARAAELASGVGSILRDLFILDPERETLRLTASIGVVSGGAETPFDGVAEMARRRLFRARAEGGNRVVSSDGGGGGGAARIVIADDDDIAAKILTHRLDKEGFDIRRYEDGAEAFEAVLADTPDLVLLDIKMPGMDGFEILERLRRTPACADVPIIMVTSMASETDVVRGFDLGADDYVLKPFSPIELVARVRRLLARGRVTPGV